nr:transposase, MuDR, MULE transposase domain protein [Tanacetum cinerariifolium]
MSRLQDIQTDAYDKLCQVGPSRWSRAHCPLVRYNYLTSNSVESVNACIVVYRKLPMLKLAETYRAMVQEGLPTKPDSLEAAPQSPIQTPPAPQDEDEHEPMFIQPHDPDYVPEPMYPEYILLEDEHVFLIKEQPLPPVDSPTAESPRYVVETDPEEDLEEYEDDESEDDDAYDEDEDEDEDDEEEEEHLTLADTAVVVPTVEPVSPPEGTEPVIPPPFTDNTTTRARITIWLQASISLPPKAEVERLLAMPTPPPSPLTSLPPPFARERLV